jgi:hypothetical protein
LSSDAEANNLEDVPNRMEVEEGTAESPVQVSGVGGVNETNTEHEADTNAGTSGGFMHSISRLFGIFK